MKLTNRLYLLGLLYVLSQSETAFAGAKGKPAMQTAELKTAQITPALPPGPAPLSGMSSPQVPPANPYVYPNQSVGQYNTVVTQNPGANPGQILQLLSGLFGSPGEDPYAEESGWGSDVSPTTRGSKNHEGYFYKPMRPYSPKNKVNNDYSKLCDRIPANPAGITGAKLKGRACTARSDRMTCMVCNIYFEARSEPEAGQLEAARTVVTRMFSDAYPDTACKVVWQTNGTTAQYSWTNDNIKNEIPANADESKLNEMIGVATAALCQGPDERAFTNYYADYVNPYWAKGNCAKGTATRIPGSLHHFCSINGVSTRSLDTVAEAEGFRKGPTVNYAADTSGDGETSAAP